MQPKATINRVLGRLGLSSLDSPSGLAAQFGSLIRDHDHFRSLLVTCEPEERRNMYEALAPNLRFKAKPLVDYMIEAKSQAEREQLPEWDHADGTFKAFQVPDIRTIASEQDFEADINTIISADLAKHVLMLVCKKCTREEKFTGLNRAEAVQKARDAGWVYSALGEGIEICPKCPAFRATADHKV